jgi:hypothetical protein
VTEKYGKWINRVPPKKNKTMKISWVSESVEEPSWGSLSYYRSGEIQFDGVDFKYPINIKGFMKLTNIANRTQTISKIMFKLITKMQT